MRRRRSALRILVKTTGSAYAVAAVGCAGPPGTTDTETDAMVPLPSPVAGRITLKLADFPQLLGAGGGLVGRAPGVEEPIGIIHDEGSRFLAVVATCTHLACPLRFNSLNVTFDCSCHGSTFELDGRVINGPATRPLRTLPIEFDGVLLGIQMA